MLYKLLPVDAMKFKLRRSYYLELLTVLNIIVFVLAAITICLSAILLGIYAFMSFDQWDSAFEIAPYMVIGLGIYDCIISSYACFIIYSQNRCLLLFFAFLTSVALIIQAVTFSFYAQIQTKILQGCCPPSLTDQIQNLGGTNNAWDNIQQTYKCCGSSGYDGYREWFQSSRSVPDSCCHNYFDGCASGIKKEILVNPSQRETAGKIIYTHGCQEIIQNDMEGEINNIIQANKIFGMVLGAIEVLIIAFLFAHVAQLTRKRRKELESRFSNPSPGMISSPIPTNSVPQVKNKVYKYYHDKDYSQKNILKWAVFSI